MTPDTTANAAAHTTADATAETTPNPAPSLPAEPPGLRTWLDQLLQQHDTQPAAVAAALAQRAPALPADAEGAEALRLAEHVLLAHLADVPGLQAFVDALPAPLGDAPATAPSLQRLRWALATLTGQPGPALPDAPRWRALQNVVLAMAATGRSSEAAALMLADEPTALAQGQSDAGKACAAAANNVASHLQTGPRGDAARDALMLQAAALARRAWASAGGWMQVERADYRLALCHAVLGQGAEALAHARQCLAACVAGGEAAGEAADAVEHFFAHEALVRAHHAAGDAQAAAAATQRMHTLLADIPEADGLRAWCADVLADLPR